MSLNRKNTKSYSTTPGSYCKDIDFFPYFFRIRNMFTLSEDYAISNDLSDQELLGCFGIDVRHIITQGAYSKAPIYAGIFQGISVAIKTVSLTEARYTKHAKTELIVVKQIAHPNIVNHYAYFRASNRIFNVMEYVPDGTLGKYIKSNLPKSNYLDRIFYEILLAIRYLHNKLIVHRDIKDENIVLKFNEGCAPTPKLCDFGFALKLDSPDDLCSSYCGTKSFKSPELLHAEAPYNPFKSEVWALGILLHKMHTRKVPVYCTEKRKINVETTFFSRRVYEILLKTLRVDPDERADVKELLNCKMFRVYNKSMLTSSGWRRRFEYLRN